MVLPSLLYLELSLSSYFCSSCWYNDNMDGLLVTIVALFIFPVDLVIRLRIPSINGLLGKGVYLLSTISWNYHFGVRSQNIQIILPSLRVSVIPSNVVVVYVTLQFDMIPPTLF